MGCEQASAKSNTAAQLRRAEINLATLGTGVIAFGVWTFVKLVFIVLLDNNLFEKDVSDFVKAIVIALIFVGSALVLLFRCFIGFSARGVGNKGKKHIVYLICAGILLVFSSFVIIIDILSLFFWGANVITTALTAIVDFTSAAITLELMINGVRVRRFRKQNALKEAYDER